MATAAARRAVISLIKSTARGKREKRPRQSLRASRIKAWFLIAQGRRPYRGEKKSTSFVILAQSGIMELGNYVGGGAKQKGFYTSAVLRLVLRPCLSQKQMRKISKDRQRGSGRKKGDRLCMKTTENSALQFVEESLQFVMNGWGICMQTMLKAARVVCSNT